MFEKNEFIIKFKQKIDKELDEVLDTYQKPKALYEPAVYAVKIGGKRLRPMLCYLIYNLLSKGKEEFLYPALAVELLHTFTLVHDDIMDDDDLRRGKETVHKKWDLATGVLSGDALVSMAYDVLLKKDYPNLVSVVRIFAKGIVEVCEGQSLDTEFETRENVTEDEYLEMIDKKTAALLRVPAVIGALLANASDKELSIIKNYATNLGLAFQIQDDLLDIAADEKLLGKTHGSDVQAGKKTYLYIKALVKFPKLELKEYLQILKGENTSDAEVLRVKKLYKKYDVLQEAKDEAKKRIELAYQCIEELDSSYDKKELLNFTDFILKREY